VNLLRWRANWAKTCNERLQEKDRIDHRTLEAQGIDREPTIHIGVTAKALERKGIITPRVQQNRAIIARNEAKYIHEAKEACVHIDKKIAALTQESAEANREAMTARHKAEQITDRAEYIQTLQNRIDQQRNAQLERSLRQAEKMFRQMYKIAPQQAEHEAQRLEDRARSLGHLREKLSEKIAAFDEERAVFAKVDGREIRDKLTHIRAQERKREQFRERYR
jgi:archaellum component FlaC